MAELVLFHHIQGLTEGVHGFAEAIREAGHIVHVPDLFGGHTFASLGEGEAFLHYLGFDHMRDRGLAAVEGLPNDLIYAGFSMGVLPAQQLFQTRPGVRAGIFYHGFGLPSYFGQWPAGVPVQIHAMNADPIFVGEGDIDAARLVARRHPEVELHLYPGLGHLFTDSSLADFDEQATALVLSRTLALLERVAPVQPERAASEAALGL
ncbi:MAG: dienelactone hydrolase family protein [Propionibacteriaceae bacterium]|nr:dienelactone hydrolase family protein [Propionibacteriaceae bacterium]